MKLMHGTSHGLLVIGGLNWGLVGLGYFMGSDWNLVHFLLGSWAWLENLVYVLVGVAAVMAAFTCKRDCRQCNPGTTSAPAM